MPVNHEKSNIQLDSDEWFLILVMAGMEAILFDSRVHGFDLP
jgi:hypothetical protein